MRSSGNFWKIRRFTLVELIVVITILAILATIGFLALSGYTEDAKEASIKTNVRSVYSAIVSESAVTGNSARYYIVHDTGASLSWAVIAVDGNPIALTGGDWNAAWTNYSAGKPDFAKLKLNPAKFRISHALPLLPKTVSESFAADYKELLAGAAEIVRSGANGKSRPMGFLQVAWVSPITKIASVTGNIPADAAWNPMGLIKDPSDSATASWFVIDGKAIGTFASATPKKSCLEVKNSWGWTSDGIYSIDPDGDGGNAPIQAYCDMNTDGGGWTLTFYAPSMPTDGSANLTANQVVIKGQPLKTYTSDSSTYPVLGNGTSNTYSEVLFKWGNASWVGQKGGWSRFATFPAGTTAMSVTFDGVLNADGSTTLYHHSRGWTTGTVNPTTALFWIWDDAGLSNICWGSGTPGWKNCPYFEYTAYSYHYEVASPRWLFVR